jgi:hypothetical protein
LTAGANGMESESTFPVWAKLGTAKKMRKKTIKMFLCIKHLLQKQVKGLWFKVQRQALNPNSIANLIKHNLRISKKQAKSFEKK